MGSVVIGYVSRPEGEAALAAGIEEARRRGSDVVVVRRPVDDEPVPDEVPDLLARSDLRHEVRPLPPGSDFAEELVSAAAGPDDLIVIGVRRRSRTGKLILGTSVQHVLLDAACPVLTVKGDR